jgi:hypothetical protein
MSLIAVAERWVIEHYTTYNSRHLTQSLVWLDRLFPGSREAVRLATLTHDMERAFPGPDMPPIVQLNDPAYYRAHSERSARIVGAWLREQAADARLVSDVEALVRVHEVGGWPEANQVQAADSISFLETNVDLFLGFGRSRKYAWPDIKTKFQWMYDRMQIEPAREAAAPFLAAAQARLEDLEREMSRDAERPVPSGAEG